MRLTRWEPFRGSDEFFRNTMPALFGRWPQLPVENGDRYEWSPVADIAETDEEYLVKAELPGIKREEVKVALEDGMLTISGERRQEKEVKERRMHRIERFYGTFSRSFWLPDDADADLIRADCKEGVLTVHIPKTQASKPKAIEIKVN
ncbi:MAG: Hsp20/alpha crystallin family protein [Gammaproteobacteria bacterium]